MTKPAIDHNRKPTAGATLYREFTLDRAALDGDKRTVELSFSSECPVERGWGMEVLDHSPGACDLSRLNAGAAVLVNHDRSYQVGAVVSARVDSDRKGRAVIRFGRGNFASEIWQDVQDGIRSLVSVGYRVDDVKLESSTDGVDTYRALRWTPVEISLVAVPADATVGVGRAAEPVAPASAAQCSAEAATPTESQTETKPVAKGIRTMPENTNTVDVAALTADTRKAELARAANIRAMAVTHGMVEAGEKAIAQGATPDEFSREVIAELARRQSQKPQLINPDPKELKRWSLFSALAQMATKSTANSLEREMSAACAKLYGREPRGIFIPPDAFAAWSQRTAVNKTTVAQGGYLVGTDNMGGSFVELLRGQTVALQAGARTMQGLRDSITIPTQTGGATAYWLGETTDVTESNQTFGQVAMTPKTVACTSRMTRKMQVQSDPSVEQIVRDDLIQTIAYAIDLAVFEGAGTSEPTGIVNLGGNVNTVAFGSTTPTWAKLIDMQTALGADKALRGTLAYVGSPQTRGVLMQTQKYSSTNGMSLMEDPNTLAGYPFFMSNSITATNLFFGNFADCIIGFWSGVDIVADNITYDLQGGLRLVAYQDMDIGFRHDVSFCYSTNMTNS